MSESENPTPFEIDFFGFRVIKNPNVPKGTAYIMKDPFRPEETVIVTGIGPKSSLWKRFWKWLKKAEYRADTVTMNPSPTMKKRTLFQEVEYIDGYEAGYNDGYSGEPSFLNGLSLEGHWVAGYRDGYQDGIPETRPCS